MTEHTEPTAVLHEKHTVSDGAVVPTEGGLNNRAPRVRRKLADALDAERKRIEAILAEDEQFSVSDLTHHLAFGTDAPADVALGIIRKARSI